MLDANFLNTTDKNGEVVTLNKSFYNSYDLLTIDKNDFDSLLTKAEGDYSSDMSLDKVKYYITEFGHFEYIKKGNPADGKIAPKQLQSFVKLLAEDTEHFKVGETATDNWVDNTLTIYMKKPDGSFDEGKTYKYDFVFNRLKQLSDTLIKIAEASCKWFNDIVDKQVCKLKEKKGVDVVLAKKFDQNYLSEYFWYKIKFHYKDNPISLSVFFNLSDKSTGEFASLIRVAIEVHESQTKKISSFYKEKVNQAIDIILNDLSRFQDKNLMCAYADSYSDTVYEEITEDTLKRYRSEPTDNNKRLHVGYIVLKPGETLDDDKIGERIQKAFKVLADLCEQISYSTTIERDIYETLYVRCKKQMILHGAPGTGKTYGAKQYVKQATGYDDNRSKVIQFHPSYDYTDFVEGIRPITDANSPDNKMIFVKMDGDFKSFCRMIVSLNLYRVLSAVDKNIVVSSIVSAVDINRFDLDQQKLDALDFDNVTKYLINKSSSLSNDEVNFLYALLETLYKLADNYASNIKLEDDEQFLLSLFNSIHAESSVKDLGDSGEEEDQEPEPDVGNEPDGTSGTELPDDEDDGFDEDIEEIDDDDDNGEVPYFFIIDEINRADISKVLGELMYGFEYRGIENRFPTQYSQLNIVYTENNGEYEKLLFDCFKDGFFVPENLVVIGTMNDIDKSVESFDFAMRRRFHWIQIKADIVMEEVLKGIFSKTIDLKKYKKTISLIANRMNEMNIQLVKDGAKFGLDDNYKIGPDYLRDFFKYRLKKQGEKRTSTSAALDKVFELSIEPTIREYLRGQKQDKVDDLVKNCRTVFKKTKNN